MPPSFTFHAWISGILSLIGSVLLLPCVSSKFWIITETHHFGLFQKCEPKTNICENNPSTTGVKILQSFVIVATCLCIPGTVLFIIGSKRKNRSLLFTGGWTVFIGGLFVFLACTFISTPVYLSNISDYQYFGSGYILGWVSALFTLWGSLWNCAAASAVDQVIVSQIV